MANRVTTVELDVLTDHQQTLGRLNLLADAM